MLILLQGMELLLLQNLELLQAAFKVYKAKDKTRYLWVQHWVALLESLNLLGLHTGLDKFGAKVWTATHNHTVDTKRHQMSTCPAHTSLVISTAKPRETHRFCSLHTYMNCVRGCVQTRQLFRVFRWWLLVHSNCQVTETATPQQQPDNDSNCWLKATAGHRALPLLVSETWLL